MSFKWLSSEEKLEKLYHLLKDEFIEKIDIEHFKKVFSGVNCNKIENKITWIKIGLNRQPNKKSITDLINVLEETSMITYKDSVIKILNACFKSEKQDLKFTHANRSKKGNYSEYRIDLERIVKSL